MIKITKCNIRNIIIFCALGVGFFVIGKVGGKGTYYWATAICGGMIVFDLVITYVNQLLDAKIERLLKQLENEPQD